MELTLNNRDALVELVAGIPHVGALAFGGSSATSSTDADSDVDLFVFCLDEHLLGVLRSALARMEQLTPARVVHGPMLSHRFGIKIFAILDGGLWADIFFNSPLIFSPLPMTAKMRFLNDAHRAFVEQHFAVYRSGSATSQLYILEQAWIEGIDALRGMVKNVRRGIDSGFAFYRGRFATIYYSLRLQELGAIAFDPHLVERKLHAIVRANEVTATLESEVPRSMTMDSIRTCYRKLEECMRRAPQGPELLDTLLPASAVLDRMLAAPVA